VEVEVEAVKGQGGAEAVEEFGSEGVVTGGVDGPAGTGTGEEEGSEVHVMVKRKEGVAVASGEFGIADYLKIGKMGEQGTEGGVFAGNSAVSNAHEELPR
jgi:hypothetical protein